MLTKLVAIKNVGRFFNSSAAGNPQLRGRTLILGANGFGKTTLCSILRSLQSGKASEILGRRTLGARDLPTVEILTSAGMAQFRDNGWSRTLPALAIFDGTFVTENVHSGEAVETEQKRNLYRVIIGTAGVKLADREASLVVTGREKTSAVTAATRALASHIPPEMSLETFLGLEPGENLDNAIALQVKTVDAAQRSSTIRERPALTEFPTLWLPDGFSELLRRRPDDVAADAETALAAHLARHGMADGGQEWLSKGLRFLADDSCPFCGQDIQDIPIVTAFRSVFSEGYQRFRREILTMRDQTESALGAAALSRFEVTAEKNSAALDFWNNYCDLGAPEIGEPESLRPAAQELRDAALGLVERKAATPLDVVEEDAAFVSAMQRFEVCAQAIDRVNRAIRNVNTVVAQKKDSLAATTVADAERELRRLQAVRARHSRLGKELVTAYQERIDEKGRIEQSKLGVRARLNAHTRTIVRPYERRINHYLDAFNAGFRIAETGHSYRGGVAASEYQLVINDVNVRIGDRRTPIAQPSFKNTLSAGDRTTLSLAFFLANLESDPHREESIVVFDDPFSSQDAFRRRQTIHEIGRVAGECRQVIVLSHDATFLKQLWEKAPTDDRVALAMLDHRTQGTRITETDLEKACQGRTATDIDHLQGYLTTGAGELVDVVRKMRVVLEAYCRATYPYDFSAGDWLGDIVKKIRNTGSDHPAYPVYDELDQVNDYSKEYHHGEDVMDATPDQIDPTELTGFVRRTLRLVNALQA